ncbi:MAG: hypothetical protein ACRDV4_05575 [Acidimicrobiales bacterium]
MELLTRSPEDAGLTVALRPYPSRAIIRCIQAPTPLPTLLSRLLVAYTIELDNEFEHRLSGARRRAFRVSLVMWENFMRLVGAEPRRVKDLARLAGLTGKMHAYLAMKRWGYVAIGPDPEDDRASPPRGEWIVSPTAVGSRATDVWQPLSGVMDERWRGRFGEPDVADLRGRLESLVGTLGVNLPRYLPVVRYGMFTDVPPLQKRRSSGVDPSEEAPLPLSALLSLVLLEFTVEFETESEVSLPVSANVLRVMGEDAVRVRDLPVLGGISKEAVAVAAGFLERHGYAVTERGGEGGRTRLLRLTPEGRGARGTYEQLLPDIEQRWRARFGVDTLDHLRRALGRVTNAGSLSEGLVPHPDGWRASSRYAAATRSLIESPLERLPHHPVVTHRGGWPDGS